MIFISSAIFFLIACALNGNGHKVDDFGAGHPLRSPTFIMKKRIMGKNQPHVTVSFRKDGRVIATNSSREPEIGEWELTPGGRIKWCLRNSDNTVSHTYSAELHLNHFGAEARMLKGIVLRNRKPFNLFRRVVASFEADGITYSSSKLKKRR
mmetsp:Transcript_4355/g.4472  ORF Transcript_4355/g.4472 Transcript_4355/m.4472 type:complete len:152 (+) Transcript_4355:160-615(+)